MIHLFLSNARYHHAKVVLVWLGRPDYRIELHFVPAYLQPYYLQPYPWHASRPEPIARLWGLTHKHITPNRYYAWVADFRHAVLTLLREEARRNWDSHCDSVSASFRIISPQDFRILA